jgi:hypothetical protein
LIFTQSRARAWVRRVGALRDDSFEAEAFGKLKQPHARDVNVVRVVDP